ncbi:MAG: GTPase Era, partial [Gammaproteobacteria bacterium]|nr:GTPase Era [Gammaproteobacteria bacterium]
MGRSGYVSIAGRSNTGKSTLLNCILGQKISITSRKPQTTRHRLLGIKTLADNQVIYVDSPGLQENPHRAINRYMNRTAGNSLEGTDLLLFLVEALQWHDGDEHVLRRIRHSKAPVILVVNKIDKVKQRPRLLAYIQETASKMPFAEVFPLSAKTGNNVPALEEKIISLLPTGTPLFPEDQITDRSERFLAAELIREKLMHRLGQELPYRLTVEIERFSWEENSDTGKKLLHIYALIWVERQGQKAIIIGKQGKMLKSIGVAARQEMESQLDCKIFLQLWVKVKTGWSDDE